jgi:prolyl oligopeptidase
MRVLRPLVSALALCALAMSSESSPLAAQSAPHYPVARKSDQSDSYFGKSVADPYRWLEDTDSPETRQWIEAENALTFQYLSAIPERASIKEQLTRVWNYPKYAVPIKRGKDYFITENSGLQNQPVIYVQRGLKGVRKMVLDPNTLSTDGTVALGAWDATGKRSTSAISREAPISRTRSSG